jgi:hypothetical protein
MITHTGRVAAPTYTDDSQVWWQTCFWTLVILGLNTMAQPSGRVLELPARYGTYLRSSPIICLADILSIFARLIYCCFTPSSGSLQHIIAERFEVVGSSEDMESIISTAWVRWLCFLLGPLPQIIRLASFQGVYWTKLWAFGFVLSWLLVEVLILLSPRTFEEYHIIGFMAVSKLWMIFYDYLE